MTGVDPRRRSLEADEAERCLALWLHRADKDGEAAREIQDELFQIRDELATIYAGLPETPANTARARKIATTVHVGQRDKLGVDYIEHPQRVAGYVGDSPDAVAAAWLHDVLEDGPFNATEFRHGMAVIAHEVSPLVAIAVYRLTKTPHDAEDCLASYYRRIRDNPLALAVKTADINDNTDPKRTSLLAPAERERLRIKYEHARASLGIDGPWAQSGRNDVASLDL